MILGGETSSGVTSISAAESYGLAFRVVASLWLDRLRLLLPSVVSLCLVRLRLLLPPGLDFGGSMNSGAFSMNSAKCGLKWRKFSPLHILAGVLPYLQTISTLPLKVTMQIM